VTNAFRHTSAATVCTTTTLQPSRVHVEVYDNDPAHLPVRPTPATAPTPDALAEHGRGLLMLQHLAARWDWELCGGEEPFGKAIWFELLCHGRR
jgi:anti-sigma regulatory factor (Ser/Thr protein kinase)